MSQPTSATTQSFLDPQQLLRSSMVKRRSNWRVVLLFFGVAVGLTYIGGSQLMSTAMLIAALALMFIATHNARSAARAMSGEAQAVQNLEELVVLRRWSDAASHAQRVLSRPMITVERRMRALLSLSTILSRYHRFDDARQVQEYLLRPAEGSPQPDAHTAHALRAARAMVLLRLDLLVDADSAITELRREVARARDVTHPADARQALRDGRPIESAGLLLVELYRDVKTGHHEEAIATFEPRIAVLREQLAHRMGDAWVLAAAAYHAAGRRADAERAYANATLLVPAIELHRRYPETATLAAQYPASQSPGSGT